MNQKSIKKNNHRYFEFVIVNVAIRYFDSIDVNEIACFSTPVQHTQIVLLVVVMIRVVRAGIMMRVVIVVAATATAVKYFHKQKKG